MPAAPAVAAVAPRSSPRSRTCPSRRSRPAPPGRRRRAAAGLDAVRAASRCRTRGLGRGRGVRLPCRSLDAPGRCSGTSLSRDAPLRLRTICAFPVRAGFRRRRSSCESGGVDLDTVLYSVDGPVARVVMNRPDKRNALDHQLLDDIDAAFDAAEADPEVRVVVLSGAGPSFCSGYDLSGSYYTSEPEGGWTVANGLDRLRGIEDRYRRIWDFPKPTVAQVQGHALAGGCYLQMLCDISVAAHDAVLGSSRGEDGWRQQHAAVAGAPRPEEGSIPPDDRSHRRRARGRADGPGEPVGAAGGRWSRRWRRSPPSVPPSPRRVSAITRRRSTPISRSWASGRCSGTGVR